MGPFNLHDSVSMTSLELDDDSVTLDRSRSHSKGGPNDKPTGAIPPPAFSPHKQTQGRRGISQCARRPLSAIPQGDAGLREAVPVSLTLQVLRYLHISRSNIPVSLTCSLHSYTLFNAHLLFIRKNKQNEKRSKLV